MTDKKVLTCILAFILIALACAGAILFSGWYTNGFECASGLYLKYNGAVINGGEIELPESGQATFEVKSAGFDKEIRYAVQIAPSKDADFNYLIGREYYKFCDIENLNGAFELEYNENGFTIECKTMNAALTDYYAGATVLLAGTVIDLKPYCTLTVTAGEKSVSVNLILKMIYVDLSGSGIEINPPGVIF